MITENAINAAEAIVKERAAGYDSSHDWWHTDRVRKLAVRIAARENFDDPELLQITALFHDYADLKFSKGNPEADYEFIGSFLDHHGLKGQSGRIINAIRNISFSSAAMTGDLNDPLFHIVQDADRLDAIGAVGIARAFAYGAYRNNPIWLPADEPPRPTTIAHFHDKLLRLHDMMNTDTGRLLAAGRHLFLETYLRQFLSEINLYDS